MLDKHNGLAAEKGEGSGKMRQIAFDCEIVTPMFLYGADGKTPELRAPSLKGVLRFWWRAAQAEDDIEEIKKREAGIFGDSGTEGRSKFSIQITGGEETERIKMLPHHTGNKSCPYLPACGRKYNPDYCSKGYKSLALKQQKFKVIFRFVNLPANFSDKK